VWGAVLSTGTLAWTIYRELDRRGRLRVQCYIGHIVGDPTFSPKKRWLVWNVTNIGKEPVVLTHIGGNHGANAFIVNTRERMPVTLKPGEYFTSQSDDLSVLREGLVYLCAHDSLGRIYKAPQKVVDGLKKKYASGAYDGPSAN
jgi:hypothetical protein